ncbi:MAG: RNA-binding protein [Cyanobacteriota bacterium]|jgi:ribosomal protein S1
MSSTSWKEFKSHYQLGQFIQGEVEFHTPFGVFLKIDDSPVKGLIKIPDFLDEGEMNEAMYPGIGTIVGAVVVGYNESNCREVYLSAKPSVLHKALVPLKVPELVS